MDQQAPYSSVKRQEHNKKMSELAEKTEKEFTTRKESNAKYAMKRAKEIIEEYKKDIKDTEELQEEAKRNGAFYVPKEPEFFVVVRIRGVNKVPPTERKILELIRLKKPNHAICVRNNGPMRSMLHRVRSHIAYGFCDIHLLRALVYKRGIVRIDNKSVNLTNEAIEDHFEGKIKTVEDLIYQIYKGTDLFKKANNFLCPFTLNPPRKGFGGRKAKDVIEGGSTGCHHDKIDKLISRMIE